MYVSASLLLFAGLPHRAAVDQSDPVRRPWLFRAAESDRVQRTRRARGPCTPECWTRVASVKMLSHGRFPEPRTEESQLPLGQSLGQVRVVQLLRRRRLLQPARSGCRSLRPVPGSRRRSAGGWMLPPHRLVEVLLRTRAIVVEARRAADSSFRRPCSSQASRCRPCHSVAGARLQAHRLLPLRGRPGSRFLIVPGLRRARRRLMPAGCLLTFVRLSPPSARCGTPTHCAARIVPSDSFQPLKSLMSLADCLVYGRAHLCTRHRLRPVPVAVLLILIGSFDRRAIPSRSARGVLPAC